MKTIQQLSLFQPTIEKFEQPSIPSAILQAMKLGAALAISVSGGKDSDALLRYLAKLHKEQRWSGEVFAITADLGRIEWPGTLEHIQAVCHELDMPLVVVRRSKGGMIERWDERRQTLIAQQVTNQKEGDKPFWSSSAARYCTKELKTAQVDQYLRQFGAVVCAVGIRAEESSSRAKKPHFQVRNDIATKELKTARGLSAIEHEEWAEKAITQWVASAFKGRLALTWNAVFDWPIEAVWQELGTSGTELERRRALYQTGQLAEALRGWPAHWAYVSGNSRLSCSLCVLASAMDIRNGAQHNLATWLELSMMERESGWSFQQGKWLSELAIDAARQWEKMMALYQVLASLQLVTVLKMRFTCDLLTQLPTAMLALWQKDAYVRMAEMIGE
jgi:3'-phosphoadenosine 5'-phosphosulfate sulfotransferase (PAPS reductase)/FAD synthetase